MIDWKELVFRRDRSMNTIPAACFSSPPSSLEFDSPENEFANAVLAPASMPYNSPVNMSLLHQSKGHLSEELLRETANATGVGMELDGKLEQYNRYSLAEDLLRPIPRKTATRAAERLQRVYVDLRGSRGVQSPGLIRCDFSRNILVVLRTPETRHIRKSQAVPHICTSRWYSSIQECARSDFGEEFVGVFSDLCREHCIKHEFTPANSPKYMRVAERGFAITEAAEMTARIDASHLCDVDIQERLWASTMNVAADTLKRPVTAANHGMKPPNEWLYSGGAQRFSEALYFRSLSATSVWAL